MMPRGLLVAGLVLVLGGCGYLFGDTGYFRDRSGDYRDAKSTEVIRTPADEELVLQEMYPIPPIQSDVLLSSEFEVPRPAPLASGRGEEMVRIQRLGDESWALIAIAPGQLWPQVRGFLSAAGINSGRIDAGQGIIETDWLQLQDQDMQSRFRFRIERGVQRGTSQLHVLQPALDQTPVYDETYGNWVAAQRDRFGILGPNGRWLTPPRYQAIETCFRW